mmetsp:Transcript_3454/g.10429  ORF Transcript_3454/g.10429 Transcript_3454/m.10429 type:complete len:236 (-) Transcript_3454:11-718(-)
MMDAADADDAAGDPLPALSFRTMQVDDLEAVRSLHEEWFPVRYSTGFYDAAVRGKMVGTGEELFSLVAEADGTREMVGLVTCQLTNAETCGDVLFDPADAFVSEQCTRVVYVLTLGSGSRYRRRGLASELLKRCMERAAAEPGCGCVYLHVITYNAAAIRFYEANGFIRLREIQNYYRIDGVDYACYVYVRYLDRARVAGEKEDTSVLASMLAGASFFVPTAVRACLRRGSVGGG